jgi:acyl-homoserine lactone acylase PvdQ
LSALVAVTLLSVCYSEKVQETEVYACMSRYLRSEKMLDRRFRFKSNEIANETECETYLEEYRDGFYSEIVKELKNDEDFAENSDCLVVQLKKFHLAETSMKKVIYENSKKMSRRKRKKALRAIDYSIEKKMETAVMLCTTEEVFGELFEVLFSNANETESEESDDKPGEDYCHRKYIYDKNFINTTVYNVTLNPKNIDTSDLNCDEIVEHSIEEAEEELKDEFISGLERPSKRKGKCIAKTIRTHQFFEHSIKAIVLGEIGISDDQKNEERLIFVKEMKQLYESIMNC